MYYETTRIDFIIARVAAEAVRPMIKESLCPVSELSSDAYFYLHADEKSGFALVPNKDFGYDLVSVFSCVKGRGDAMLDAAQNLGANTLDCFDGYLTAFYAFRGWVEYAREANWNGSNHPDVVFFVKG